MQMFRRKVSCYAKQLTDLVILRKNEGFLDGNSK